MRSNSITTTNNHKPDDDDDVVKGSFFDPNCAASEERHDHQQTTSGHATHDQALVGTRPEYDDRKHYQRKVSFNDESLASACDNTNEVTLHSASNETNAEPSLAAGKPKLPYGDPYEDDLGSNIQQGEIARSTDQDKTVSKHDIVAKPAEEVESFSPHKSPSLAIDNEDHPQSRTHVMTDSTARADDVQPRRVIAEERLDSDHPKSERSLDNHMNASNNFYHSLDAREIMRARSPEPELMQRTGSDYQATLSQQISSDRETVITVDQPITTPSEYSIHSKTDDTLQQTATEHNILIQSNGPDHSNIDHPNMKHSNVDVHDNTGTQQSENTASEFRTIINHRSSADQGTAITSDDQQVNSTNDISIASDAMCDSREEGSTEGSEPSTKIDLDHQTVLIQAKGVSH